MGRDADHGLLPVQGLPTRYVQHVLELIAVFRAKTRAGEAWLAGLRASNRDVEDIWGETAVV